MTITIEGVTPLHILIFFICFLAYTVFKRAGWRKLWDFVTNKVFPAYAKYEWGVKQGRKVQEDPNEKRQGVEKNALPVQSR